MTTRPTCATCRWWNITSVDVAGDCQRFPPIYVEGGTEGRFPATWADDWCGEHAPDSEVERKAAEDAQ